MRFGHKVIRAGNQSINAIKQLPNYYWKKQMITVSDLQLGHWQLVIKNKSFERVLKNVEELKSVCNKC